MREELTGAWISTVVSDVKLNIVKQNKTNSQPIIFDVVIFKACIIILTMVKCFDTVMHFMMIERYRIKPGKTNKNF